MTTRKPRSYAGELDDPWFELIVTIAEFAQADSASDQKLLALDATTFLESEGFKMLISHVSPLIPTLLRGEKLIPVYESKACIPKHLQTK